MNILEVLLAAQGSGAVTQLGQQFGLQGDQASAALSALVPALAAGLAVNATRGTAASRTSPRLSGAVATEVTSTTSRRWPVPSTTADGNSILGHIPGSKDVSRQVAAQAAVSSGVGPDILKQMLPVVAAMATGAMAKNAGGAATAGLGAPAGGMGGGLLDMLTPMLGR